MTILQKFRRNSPSPAKSAGPGLIGLDISANQIHMCQIRPLQNGLFSIVAKESIGFSGSRDSLLAEPKKLKRLIGPVLRKKNFKGKRVAALMPWEQAKIILLTYKANISDVDSEVVKMLSKRIEGSIDDYVVDYVPVRSNPSDEEHMVVATVAKREAVDASCGDCHGIEGTDEQVHDAAHERLECATCHSQWAPQCFGCHMEYDADGRQWDHIEQRETAGRWRERRSDFHNGLGALGVNEHDRIELFVPGMIMTLAHPDWEDEKFVRAFAPISPHTIGVARPCESCHRSSAALGLGQGAIELRDGEIQFTPSRSLSQDGLPADAWTNVDGSLGGTAARDGHRPLNADEMKSILAAPL